MIAVPQNLVVVDVETSGLDPMLHGIVEIGAVKLATGAEFECKVRLEDGRIYDPGVYRINGVTEHEARDSSRMDVAAGFAELALWLGKAPGEEKGWVMAGSNPKFDDSFLRASGVSEMAPARGWPFLRHLVDLQTVAITYCIAMGRPIPRSLSADAIYRMLGLPEEPKPHRALQGATYEARAFLAMFLKLKTACADLERYQRGGLMTVSQDRSLTAQGPEEEGGL